MIKLIKTMAQRLIRKNEKVLTMTGESYLLCDGKYHTVATRDGHRKWEGKCYCDQREKI